MNKNFQECGLSSTNKQTFLIDENVKNTELDKFEIQYEINNMSFLQKCNIKELCLSIYDSYLGF